MSISLDKRYRDTELEKMDILDAYELVCNGRFYKNFHHNFWKNKKNGKRDAIKFHLITT